MKGFFLNASIGRIASFATESYFAIIVINRHNVRVKYGRHHLLNFILNYNVTEFLKANIGIKNSDQIGL
jgi:hypothetical protein